MTQKSPPTPPNSSVLAAGNGSGPATKTGLRSEVENTSTTVESGPINATPFSGNVMRHEDYMKKKMREEKLREKSQRLYEKLMKSSTKGSGDDPYEDVLISVDQFNNKAQKHEAVNRPSHYNQNGIECIDAIHAALGDEGFINYCHGNCMKYTWRWQRKGGLTDLDKSAQYAEFIKNVSAGRPPRG